MKNVETLNVTTPTEREIVMTRVFDAPRSLTHQFGVVKENKRISG